MNERLPAAWITRRTRPFQLADGMVVGWPGGRSFLKGGAIWLDGIAVLPSHVATHAASRAASFCVHGGTTNGNEPTRVHARMEATEPRQGAGVQVATQVAGERAGETDRGLPSPTCRGSRRQGRANLSTEMHRLRREATNRGAPSRLLQAARYRVALSALPSRATPTVGFFPSCRVRNCQVLSGHGLFVYSGRHRRRLRRPVLSFRNIARLRRSPVGRRSPRLF